MGGPEATFAVAELTFAAGAYEEKNDGEIRNPRTSDGGAGANFVRAGAARDRFVYEAHCDSTSANCDAITSVNFAHDFFHIPGGLAAVKAINAVVTTGSLSTATFEANFVAAIGAAKLGAHDAVLITASAGKLNMANFV